MGKSSKSLFIGALASTMFSGVAFAADYIPPPVVDFEPEYEADFGGSLYLRGHIGISNQQVDELDNALYDIAESYQILNQEFEGGPIAGIALGYRFNEFFRVDAGVEYRASVGFNGLDRYEDEGDGDSVAADGDSAYDGTNFYTGNKSEWLFMANAFVDLGTYAKITPYIGAGAGATLTTISNFSDVNEATSSVAYAEDNSEWAFAWALYAGLGYQVNDHLTLELGYRYLDLGDAASGDLITFDGTNAVNNPMEFNGLSSHDITLGMRWELGGFSSMHHGY